MVHYDKKCRKFKWATRNGTGIDSGLNLQNCIESFLSHKLVKLLNF